MCRPGGTVAACVWDHAGGTGPLSPFWDLVRQLDPDAGDESTPAGVRQGDLVRIFRDAGFGRPERDRLAVSVDYIPRYPSLSLVIPRSRSGGSRTRWGSAGDYLEDLDVAQVERIRQACADRLGSDGFTITATACAVRAQR